MRSMKIKTTDINRYHLQTELEIIKAILKMKKILKYNQVDGPQEDFQI